MVLLTIAPQVAKLVSPGSIPSVLREKWGDISRPSWLSQREGVRMVTPHTMKPAPGEGHPAAIPPGGVEVILTWNLAELCRVIRYITKLVTPVFRSIMVGLPMLPSMVCRAEESCHQE